MEQNKMESGFSTLIPTREKTKLVAAHLPVRYGKAVRIMAAEMGVTRKSIIEKALDLLFLKYELKRQFNR